jgi:hypothetical protein
MRVAGFFTPTLVPREYLWAALVATLGLALWWFGAHERGVAHEEDLAKAANQVRALQQEYAAKEAKWTSQLATLTVSNDALQKHVDDLSRTTPTFRVRACAAAPQTTAVPAAATAPGGQVGRAATAGLLHPAPSGSAEASGVSGYDAGPELRRDAELCDALSVRLAWWLDRYHITEGRP